MVPASDPVGRPFRFSPATYFGAAGRTAAIGTEDKGSTGGRRGGVAALDRNRWPTDRNPQRWLLGPSADLPGDSRERSMLLTHDLAARAGSPHFVQPGLRRAVDPAAPVRQERVPTGPLNRSRIVALRVRSKPGNHREAKRSRIRCRLPRRRQSLRVAGRERPANEAWRVTAAHTRRRASVPPYATAVGCDPLLIHAERRASHEELYCGRTVEQVLRNARCRRSPGPCGLILGHHEC